jgi:predicted dinucleotide-binding enzyme
MKIGVIGAGVVGQTVGEAFAAKGHEVVLGTRAVTEEELAKPRSMAVPLKDWATRTSIPVATFREAARHGEILVNATAGGIALDALALAGKDAIGSKVIIDIANPIDFTPGAIDPSRGLMASVPALTNSTSVGEEIQRAYPEARVVKALNTANIAVGVAPKSLGGDIDTFIAGDDATAKALVTDLLKAFGWSTVIDLGDITGARGTEQFIVLWFRLMVTLGTPTFGIKVVK